MTSPSEVIVERVARLPHDIDVLLAESQDEGFGAIRRLVDEWRDRENTFGRAGEAFFLARTDARTGGVCGLNIDPYANDPHVGRVRHLYVVPSLRRRGIGTALVSSVLDEAKSSFGLVRLRTDSAEAAAFYERLGFRGVDDRTATHEMELEGSTLELPSQRATPR